MLNTESNSFDDIENVLHKIIEIVTGFDHDNITEDGIKEFVNRIHSERNEVISLVKKYLDCEHENISKSL